EEAGPAFELLRTWIRTGAQRTPADAPRLVRVTPDPSSRSLEPKHSFQRRVTAEYSDGSRRDVTEGSAFQSNDRTIAAVAGEGVVQAGPVPGAAAVMARYMNHIAVCAVTIPLPGTVPDSEYERLPRKNEI